MITISFEDQPLHDTCIDLQRAEQQYGRVSAEALVTFISEALAFDHVGELIDFLGNDIKISGDDSLSVSIGSDYRAALVAIGKHIERDDDGFVDWTSVIRLKLVEISRVP